jgi:Ion transport protein
MTLVVWLLGAAQQLCMILHHSASWIIPQGTDLVCCVVGIWEKIVDASFILDIYFNFRTGYMETDPAPFLVTSAKLVALKYLRGYFFIDFFSTVPWDVVLSNDGLGFFQLVKLSKLMKLLRIARAVKLVRILRLIKVCCAFPLRFFAHVHRLFCCTNPPTCAHSCCPHSVSPGAWATSVVGDIPLRTASPVHTW